MVRFGKTTNNNESLHRLISRRIPKGGTITNDSYRLGAALAVIQFNDGVSGIAKIFQRLRIEPGRRRLIYFESLTQGGFMMQREELLRGKRVWV